MSGTYYHPSVQRDVSGILRHYDSINDRLGDEFWEELNSFINQAVANPQHFHFEAQNRRRVNPSSSVGKPDHFFDVFALAFHWVL
jgi:hypothetical protein